MNTIQYATQNTTPFDQILTQSPNMQNVIEQAKKFALLNAPLLIEGETGTGKDLLAKACHQFSYRAEQQFIAVNCAGLPEEEAETEMFGHRGTQNESMGFFEYANGGTVLLDAVSELSLEMQAKLLRFLNDGSFRRVGEDQERKVDIRVICTSQKPLNQLVAEGKVREDLYYRLNVLTLKLPPLRERLDDLPLLVEYFVSEISNQLGFSKLEYDHAFLNALSRYGWAGNLRELHNVLYRACTLSHSYRLSVKDLNLPNTTLNTADIATHLPETGTLDEMMAQYEAELLRKFYAEYPSTRKLAQRLGISHTAIANKLRAYGINSK
jgi:transcriptional regulatory protein